MSTSQKNTQSAAERRAAEAELNGLIDKHAPEHLELVTAIRRKLRKLMPTAYEIVYEYGNLGAVVISFSPSEHGHEGVFGIRAIAKEVKLYFNFGKGLPDPEKLLQGSGQTRWILMEDASTLKRPEIVRLIDEAIARNKVPFAPTSHGPVVILSKSTKKARSK